MGLFIRTKEETKNIRIKSVAFLGFIQQNVGKITSGSNVKLTLNPTDNVLVIKSGKTEITLPFERVNSFALESDVQLAKSGSGLGNAIVGGLVAGGAGAIVGAGLSKGKTNVKWIAVLSYTDKEGQDQEIVFLDINKDDKKSFISSEFERVLNEVITSNSDDITEL